MAGRNRRTWLYVVVQLHRGRVASQAPFNLTLLYSSFYAISYNLRELTHLASTVTTLPSFLNHAPVETVTEICFWTPLSPE